MPKPIASDIKNIFKSLDTNKATEPDGIPVQFVQISASVIDWHRSNIIACDISENIHSEHDKTATVRPIF